MPGPATPSTSRTGAIALESNGHDLSVDPFNADAASNAGYRYTTNASLSSELANRRLTEASMAVADFGGRRVIDIGCGDGTYTAEIIDVAGAGHVTALDPALAALTVARERVAGRPVTLTAASAYALPYRDTSFDIAYLRGVLHHMDHPDQALSEALRVASVVVVVEPNGYNPALKLLERYSTYHVEHGEKSYPPRRLDRWIEQRGGQIDKRMYAGLVPMFCPDWMARVLKGAEPLFEQVPGARAVGCAVYVFSAVGRGGRSVASPSSAQSLSTGSTSRRARRR
ncbi:MAG: class I SAM-dependent methyltransferase [Actinomycetota bacterium]|nr:class I SAM-dependent methyltransferase [Actinomycetota bacterium]